MARLPGASDFPPIAGTYVLWLRPTAPLRVQVGRLGLWMFEPGCYAYVGSAHGPGGLQARLRRHLAHEKTLHWHIDALTARVPVDAVWYVTIAERIECGWARAIAHAEGVMVPVPGFGASDCHCPAHLFRVPVAALPTIWGALNRPRTSGAGAFSFLV